MGGNLNWADMAQEEQKLLARCLKIVFGSHDAPGGRAKDILYRTPCERWLRVCSRSAYDPRLEAGDEEMAFRIDSGKVRELLDRYRWSPQPELDRPSIERDFEVGTDLKISLSYPPEEYGISVRVEETDRNNGDPRDPRSEVLRQRPQSAYPVPADPRDITGAEEPIQRNSLISLLKYWSISWPPETAQPLTSPETKDDSTALDQSEIPDQPIKLSPSQKVILVALAATDNRITHKQILSYLKQSKIKCSIFTIKTATPILKKAGLIEYSQAREPRGYFLTVKGKNFVSNLKRERE